MEVEESKEGSGDVEVGGDFHFDFADSLPFRHFDEETSGFGVVK